MTSATCARPVLAMALRTTCMPDITGCSQGAHGEITARSRGDHGEIAGRSWAEDDLNAVQNEVEALADGASARGVI